MNTSAEPIARRPPDKVMRLARLGCAHPTRLSFLRILLRRAQTENWRFDRSVWNVDADGVGVGVYRAIGPERTFSLVVFAHDLPDELRSDRVISTAWDATFTLYDGNPTQDDIERLSRNVPLQEAGRLCSTELSLSRANRSVRLFEHVVDRLSKGKQPDVEKIGAVGYLMRTTAVYGSGKFGAADRLDLIERNDFDGPFQIEMLTVWLTRQFVIDIAEHLAYCRGGEQAIRLDPELRRSLGVGNSTGLGMAPFVVRHPILLNNWMMVREEALSRVRSCEHIDSKQLNSVRVTLEQARINARNWLSEHPIQISKLSDLRTDLDKIAVQLKTVDINTYRPWDVLWRWGEDTLTLEGQEALLSILIEPYGHLVDGMAEYLGADEQIAFRLDGTMTVKAMQTLLEQAYDWALAIDFNDPDNNARFWYVSEEKLEPRLGNRFEENGAELEQPLCIARLASELYDALKLTPDQETLASFLLKNPDQRFMVRRAQMVASYPYAEIRDNLIAKDMLPIDLMRFKLAFFGANHFDPRSDRWLRISLFQDAPYPDEMNMEDYA